MIKIGQHISYLLRHNPEDLYMDKNGWVDVYQLIDKLKISFNELQNIVDNNNKKRFSFNKDKSKIRANQGHSIKVDVELKKSTPPKYLYHGTTIKKSKLIKKNGILKMKRNHVHLSKDYETALNIAERYSTNNDKPFIFKINTTPMILDNVNFYLSVNGVWLVDFVDPKYLK